MSTEATDPTRPSPARERLLRAAARLFYREGIHGVGIDRVLEEASVTRATMYRHFSGKEELVAAYLASEDATIRGYFEAAGAQTTDPSVLLTMLVDGIAEDARRYHDRGCPFINAAAEYPDEHSAVRSIVRAHRDWFRATLAQVLAAAGDPAPVDTAAGLVLLRDAALVGVYLDDADQVVAAFTRAARQLVDR